MSVKKLLLSLALVLLSACAYSPQQITIEPRIDTGGDAYGNGRAIAVSAEDAREQKVLGTRGGVYKDTSTITVANDMVQAIARAAQAKLATLGFNVNSDQPSASMNVVVEQLSYDVPDKGGLGKTIDLKCALRVDVKAGSESYSGHYRTSAQQEALMTPSMASNQQMINKLLSDTLARAFTDPKMKAFLSNI